MIPAMETRQDTLSAMRRHFGHEKFREGQAEIISAVLSGKDCIAVLPTGAGKSLCFQLPAVMRDGLTLVVSPLISLMKDQVDSLVARGIAAAFINSSLDWPTLQERVGRMARGGYKLVYVAPERFRNERFMAALARVEVGLVAVDEAHCISVWGHDFRPDYLQLRPVLERLGEPQVLATTATATPQVRADIVEQIGLGGAPRGEPTLIVTGFARPGLTLSVRRVTTHADKLARVLSILADNPTGIVYCATRAMVDKVAARIRAAGKDCIAYHGGMDDQMRKLAQERFLTGEVSIAVATNAFGMGIDRADLRTIIHWDVPGSLEAYYQEAGRAGRDGKPAFCEILFNYADVRTQEFFIDKENAGRDRVKLRQMLCYVDSRQCRHTTILNYFGDPAHGRTRNCSECDNCLRRAGLGGGDRRVPDERECVQIQKVLSCVARLHGGYGRARITQVLAGSRDQGLLRTGLQGIPTYGALSDLSQQRIRALIDALQDEGCLETAGDEYPTLRITRHGRAVMHRAEPIEMVFPGRAEKPKRPKKETQGSAPASPPGPADAFMVEALRSLRTELAAQRGMPAYIIYSNATMAAIAVAAPRDRDELLAVKGIGPAKADDFGDLILETVLRATRAE